MNETPFYTDSKTFAKALKQLRLNRRVAHKEVKKLFNAKRLMLNSSERKLILEKTDYKCHVCGIELTGSFQADHVKSHDSGGPHDISNYLPSCNLCNNYRWHYSPEEIQWVLKLGVWARGQIENETRIGKLLSTNYMSHEVRREKRRQNPRNTIR